ncbi:MAG: DNA-protecting protein DprA [Deltaproteobacteria bacterium]|nr:DNA-protecting protein DprA [Deltaproteobacteria bacterium]
MDKDDLKYWLALARIMSVGKAGKGVLSHFLEPANLFKETSRAHAALSPEIAEAVKGFDDWQWVDEEISRVEAAGAAVITFNDPGYPAVLREIDAPPCLLYAKGAALDSLNTPTTALVGTRRPTHYGVRVAGKIAMGLASMGVTVASGMARGCDAAAHKGALDAGGLTVAVLGTGVDVVYPRDNAKLYEDIVAKGVVLSEFPMTTQPRPYNFPQRNRIISGISKGVVVVEAPFRSGAMMTARLALEANREVMAVPGAVTSERSRGTNGLIKQGAHLVESASDVMSVLGFSSAKPERQAEKMELSAAEAVVWNTLGDEPSHIDAVIDKAGFAPNKAAAILIEMELKGFIRQLPGKRIVKLL